MISASFLVSHHRSIGNPLAFAILRKPATKKCIRSFIQVEDLHPMGPVPAKTRSPRGFRLLTAGFILLLALLGAGLFLLLRPSVSVTPPVVLLHDNIPKGQPTLFERFVPMKPGWGWAWKLREFV